MDSEHDAQSSKLADVTRTSSSDSAPLAGVIGTYRLLRRLGEGGMGEVWLAEQTQPVRRQVAVKLIKRGMDSAQVIARFEVERQALAVMDHPAIAKVFDGGTTDDGRPYFAMEYVRGEAITAYCDRLGLSLPARLDLFVQLCDGVQHAHQKGIIHRDLKPSNVLVTEIDDRPVPRIIDFGIAKAVSQPLTDRPLYTELVGFVGTPEYMSPEQAGLTPTDVDTRTDVYALGVMLYELLVGTLPFETTTVRKGGVDQVRQMIREQEPVRPSTRVRRRGADGNSDAERRATAPDRLARVLRGDLDAITIKALEKDRSRRYPTANALALDVRRHLQDEPVTAGSPGAAYRAQKFVRRHRWSVAAAVVLVALIGSFSVAMALQVRRTTRERDRANQEAAAAQQVSNFLVGLFRVSDPSEARGTTLTARDILSKGARDVERELGDQPRVRARIETTIGTVYTNLGMLAEAEPLLQRAVQTAREHLGADHPDTLTAMNELANLYWWQDRLKEAEPLYQDVVRRRTRALGAEHRDTLHAQWDLASLYALQGRLSEAEQLLVATLATQRRVFGPDSAEAVDSMNNLQAVYFKQKRYADAEQLAVRVLTEQRRLLGADHPATIDAAHNLATIYDKLGNFPEAERLYLEAVDAYRRVRGSHHPRTIRSILSLGRMYAAQRRFSEAERTLLQAYELSVQDVGQKSAPTRQAAGALADLYQALSDPVKAAEWRKAASE